MSGERIIRGLTICAIAAALLPFASARAGTFTVDDWALHTTVHESSSGPFDSDISTEPANPFLEILSGSVNAGSASTAYDISWNNTSASFFMDADLLITGVGSRPSGSCVSSNKVWITPHEDMLLTVYSEYTYNLPVPGMQTEQRLIVANYDGPGAIYSQTHRFSSTMGGGSDTFIIDGEVVLPAGVSWQISTNLSIYLDSGSTGRQATGSGFFDIQLTPLPEPTTAMLLLLAAAIPAIRRHRRAGYFSASAFASTIG